MNFKSSQFRTGALALCAAFGVFLGAASAVKAEPVLQLYIEGGTYDTVSDTWVYNPNSNDPESDDVLRIWAVGNVGQVGTISAVKMSVVYDDDYAGIGINLTRVGTVVATSGSAFVVNEYMSGVPMLLTGPEVTDGSSPLLGDGVTHLADHGEYGVGQYWQEFALGDFTRTDTKIADFNGTTTTPTGGSKDGHIDVFAIEIVTTGLLNPNVDLGDLVLHFDLYNHVGSANHVKYKFAPFSHDGEGTPPDDGTPNPGGGPDPIPTPAAAGMGIIGFALLGLRRFSRGRTA